MEHCYNPHQDHVADRNPLASDLQTQSLWHHIGFALAQFIHSWQSLQRHFLCLSIICLKSAVNELINALVDTSSLFHVTTIITFPSTAHSECHYDFWQIGAAQSCPTLSSQCRYRAELHQQCRCQVTAGLCAAVLSFQDTEKSKVDWLTSPLLHSYYIKGFFHVQPCFNYVSRE